MREYLTTKLPRLAGLAFLGAVALTLFLPALVSAQPTHAILLTSNPAKDAVLRTAPGQVQMWFSEDLNPALSTVQVVNSERQRVDKNDSHINAGNTKEMDISLQDNLQPDVYIVVWRTDSADDGHVLLGSFIFTVENADGSTPQLAPGSNPAQGLLGDANASAPGTMDGPTFFNFSMVTLVELAATFWVGALLWLNFVLLPTSEKYPAEAELNSRIERRSWLFVVPALLLLLLTDLGVLYGQVLTLTGNNWGAALNLQLLREQASSGRFGTYWLLRMLVLLVALLVSLFTLLSKRRPKAVEQALPLLQLFLGALFLIALTMSGHAAAVNAIFLPYSVVLDWLHLLASALWVGGMLYILLIYLPVLKSLTSQERARSLLLLLQRYSPLAIAGVVIMAISGPLNATFHLTSFEQFFVTAYGRALVVKIVLVGGLLATSAYHVGWLRPRLKKEYQKYQHVQARLATLNVVVAEPAAVNLAEAEGEKGVSVGDESGRQRLLRQQVRLRQERVDKKAGRLTRVLNWEPWLGVAVLICVGLLNVFAGTLTPATAANQANQPPSQTATASAPFNGSMLTTDGKYRVSLSVNPNRFGTNVFTVKVVDVSTGQQLGATKAGVTVYTTMLDMAMGTDSIQLQANSQGVFSGSGDLAMGGNWQIQVQVRTLDNTLHSASFKIYAPF